MKKIIKTFALMLFLTAGQASFGQTTNVSKAKEIAKEAITLMDNGELAKSMELLKEAIKLDPENISYSYELALAHTYNKDYSGSGKILKKLLKHKNIYDLVYQLIGVNYSYLGQQSKAIEYFEKGLKKFPDSGILHLERGNMDFFEKKYETALSFYENGIKVAPAFPSNYYWASKIYCSSTEEVWGMIYGEIFINMERNSKRTSEISKLLFDTYKSEIKIKNDSTISVSFCQQMALNFNSFADPAKLKLPFCMIYEPTLGMSIGNEKSIDIQSLDRIRTTFLNNYFAGSHSKSYPNILFSYQKAVQDAGHIEAYNHWVLKKGDEDGYAKWLEANKGKWDSFIKWFSENGLKVNDNNKFHQEQY